MRASSRLRSLAKSLRPVTTPAEQLHRGPATDIPTTGARDKQIAASVLSYHRQGPLLREGQERTKGEEVSVSAMQPCSASFNSLPLPREYNITNMTAAKRYESVWNAFLNELPHNPTTTLTSFLKRCNVRQGRMKRWMENHGLSVKEAKKRLRDCQHDGIGDPMSPLSEDSGSLFLPMATDKPAPRSESCDILSGVSLTFPDGTQVNIKRGSAQAVMSFLKLYQREDLPCLD